MKVNSLSRLAQGSPNGDPYAANASQNIALKSSALQVSHTRVEVMCWNVFFFQFIPHIMWHYTYTGIFISTAPILLFIVTWLLMSSTFLCCLQCLVGVLRSLGTWTSKLRGNGPVFPDLSVPELEVHADGVSADGTNLEVKDDTKPVTQADEFEKAKALKVTMESAVAKVLPSLSVPRQEFRKIGTGETSY